MSDTTTGTSVNATTQPQDERPSAIQRVSQETLDRYLARFTGDPNTKTTTGAIYRSVLRRFYNFLPEDKQIDAQTLSRWEDTLKAKRLKPDTIRLNLRIVRAFLRDAGVSEDVISPPKPKPVPETISDTPELSRAEYLFLLRQARAQGKEKAYLIIKTLCQTGLKGTELAHLTVEALRAGGGWIDAPRETKFVRVPPLLCAELLRYAAQEQIASGAVFVTRDGQPLHRVQVWKLLQQVCRRTGLPEEKWQLANLHKLYWDTQKTLRAAGHTTDLDAVYDALLAQEEETVRWTDCAAR